jgi:hypothetical protein
MVVSLTAACHRVATSSRVGGYAKLIRAVSAHASGLGSAHDVRVLLSM